MQRRTLRELPPIPPEHFFDLSIQIRKKGKRVSYLPDTSFLTGEPTFARMSLTWSPEGMAVYARVERPLVASFYPKYRSGDSLELFFETRLLQKRSSIHRFCHHFLFLPQKVGEVEAQEITTFHPLERRPQASPDLLLLQTSRRARQYEMKIEIPQEGFYGYDPLHFNTLRFSYRLNCYGGEAQSFFPSSNAFSLEKDPSLWATLALV